MDGDFCVELLQPARNASDTATLAGNKIVRVSENIVSLVRHPVVTNKFRNRQKFGIDELTFAGDSGRDEILAERSLCLSGFDGRRR